jgi:hypothetical protein
MSGGGGDTDAEDEEGVNDDADERNRLAVDACREPCDGDDADECAKSGVPDADGRADSITLSPPSPFTSSASMSAPASASASLANDASVAPALTGASAMSAAAELELELGLGLDERAIAAADGDEDDSGARACSPPNEARREPGFDAPLSLLTVFVSSAVDFAAALDLAAAAAAAVLAPLALPLGSSAAPCLSPAACCGFCFPFAFSSARTSSAICRSFCCSCCSATVPTAAAALSCVSAAAVCEATEGWSHLVCESARRREIVKKMR